MPFDTHTARNISLSDVCEINVNLCYTAMPPPAFGMIIYPALFDVYWLVPHGLIERVGS